MSGECSDSSQELPVVINNKFANDGSFLEMFKQMQKNSGVLSATARPDHSTSTDPLVTTITTTTTTTSGDTTEEEVTRKSSTTEDTTSTSSTSAAVKKPVMNKRRPKTLKTGLIKKQRTDEEEADGDGEPTDHWNQYMREVRKYKDKYGDDNDKNRPLVK